MLDAFRTFMSDVLNSWCISKQQFFSASFKKVLTWKLSKSQKLLVLFFLHQFNLSSWSHFTGDWLSESKQITNEEAQLFQLLKQQRIKQMFFSTSKHHWSKYKLLGRSAILNLSFQETWYQQLEEIILNSQSQAKKLNQVYLLIKIIAGGVVAVHVEWSCNLDWDFNKYCLPK